jgi:hypothetical protein
MKQRKYGDERSPEVLAYLQELVEVGRKHGFLLGHEDSHGAFEVKARRDGYGPARAEGWLLDAADLVSGPEETD